MADASYVITNFQGGEWSQAMQGRLDDQRYRTALNVCFNGLPIEEGPWVRRPGTKFISALVGPARVLPFAFQNAAPYTMVFTDNGLTFVNGTKIVPGFLSTPYVKGSANDWQNLRVVQADKTAVLLTGKAPQQFTVSQLPGANSPGSPATFNAVGPISFLDGPYLDIPTDGTALTPSATAGSITITLSGGSTRFTLGTDVGRLVRFLGQPTNWNPATSYPGGSVVFYQGNTWEFFVSTSGNSTAGVPPPGQVFTGTGVGWSLLATNTIWTWGTITAVSSPTVATLSVQGPAAQYNQTTLLWRLGVYSNTTGWPTCGCYHEGRLWLSGAVPNRIDGSVNAVPQVDSNFGSLVNTTSPPIFCFSPTDMFGNVTASNGISATFLSEETNAIFWMQPDQQGIICGTRGGEWLVQATSSNAPLTPTSIQAHRYTRIKCANILPVRCNLTLVFVQLFQRKLIEYFADVFSGRMTGPNLSETAKHLAVNFFQELAYQQETNPVLWARDSKGNLLGCSYKRENLFSREKPTFAGWHRHQLGSGRQVVSICTAGNSTGLLDALFLVTFDPVANNYWLEILGDVPDENVSTLTSFDYLDASSLVTTYTDNGPVTGTLILSGLSYLAGKTVTVWAGGLDAGDYTVSNTGTITVTYGDGINSGPNGTSNTTGTTNPGGGAYLLTSAYVQSFGAGNMPIYVGFTYNSQGQLVRPQAPAETGARSGPGFGKKRRNHQYAVQAVNSQGLSFGTSFTASLQMYAANFKDATETVLPVNQLFTGIHWDTLADDYSFDGMLAWQVTRPYPATVAAVGGFIHTQDK